MHAFGKTLAVTVLAGAALGLAAPTPASAQTDQNGNWLRNQLGQFLGNDRNDQDAQRRAYEAGRRDAERQGAQDWRDRRYGERDEDHYARHHHVDRDQFGAGDRDRYGASPYGEDHDRYDRYDRDR